MTLSIINPVKLIDTGTNVDSNYKYEKEELFNPNDITWIFYGSPYEHIVLDNGNIETKYGFKHSCGYIESIKNSRIKYDILFGIIIDRIDSNYISDSESESEINLESIKEINKSNKLKRKANFDKYKIFVDEFNHMDFESEYDCKKNKIYIYRNSYK